MLSDTGDTTTIGLPSQRSDVKEAKGMRLGKKYLWPFIASHNAVPPSLHPWSLYHKTA